MPTKYRQVVQDSVGCEEPRFYHFVYERYMATWEAVFASTYIDLTLGVYLTAPYKTDSDVKSSVPEHRTETSENTKKMSTVIFPSSLLNSNVSIKNALSKEVPTNTDTTTLKKKPSCTEGR